MLIPRHNAVLLFLIGLATAEIKEKGWWKNTVFYQIYPRSFMDSNDDGIGDLRGITAKLQHFKNSGIGAIWLSPIYASPMIDFGYDISDFRKIDEGFGTMADFEYLTKKAKQMGIKVILDLVPNHTSDKHEWFQKALAGDETYINYYIWKEGKEPNGNSPPNNWISVFSGPAWTYNQQNQLWYFHQFEYRQPDLNYANKVVRDEMDDVIKFWLSKGVDGFRIDAVPHIYERDDLIDEPRSNAPGTTPHDYTYVNHIYTKDDPRTYDLVKSWRKILDDWANEHNEDEKVMMTEAYTSLTNTTKYYQYGAQIPFNFKFITNVNDISSPQNFKVTIDDWMKSMLSLKGDYVPNWVMGNHDRPRISTRYPGRNDQMTMLAMILPGVTITYYGEEIGMEDYRNITWEDTQDPQACNAGQDQYLERSRDPNRTPFQWDNSINAGFNEGGKTWLPVHSNYKTLNLEHQIKNNQSHYKVYQALTKLKSSSTALKGNSYDCVVLNNNMVLGIVREINNSSIRNESIVLLINFSQNEIQSVNIINLVDKRYKSATINITNAEANIMWGTMVKLDKVVLPPKASFVLLSNTNSISGLGSGATSLTWSTSFLTASLSLTIF